MTVCWIGIGANLGDARLAFDAAWHSLERHNDLRLRSRSGIYHTAPVGQDAGGIFSNAVFSLETELAPLGLLDRLQAIESSLGRTRDVRWGPRPIDLDLLYVDQCVLDLPRLTVPHPAAWYRRFVLDPMAEVAPDFRHPVLHQSMAQLVARLQQRPLVVAVPFDLIPSTAATGQSAGDRPTIRLVDQRSAGTEVALGVCLDHTHFPTLRSPTVPIADLTNSPGDAQQRLNDFLVAILDRPIRVADWT